MPLASLVVEPLKVETMSEPAPVNEGNTQQHPPTKEMAIHETAPAKVEALPKVVPAKVKAKPKMVTAKPVSITKSVIKHDSRQIIKQEIHGKWGVNLIAFKQEWFAKSKAAEFARLGVFTEVIPVREKNSTLYRLRVGGFKSKAEAISNTAKLKKTLNLGSVWVSNN